MEPELKGESDTCLDVVHIHEVKLETVKEWSWIRPAAAVSILAGLMFLGGACYHDEEKGSLPTNPKTGRECSCGQVDTSDCTPNACEDGCSCTEPPDPVPPPEPELPTE